MVAFDADEADVIVDEGRFDSAFATTACDARNSQQNAEYCNSSTVVDLLLELDAAAVVACCVFGFAANASVVVAAVAVVADSNVAAAAVVALHVMTADLAD